VTAEKFCTRSAGGPQSASTPICSATIRSIPGRNSSIFRWVNAPATSFLIRARSAPRATPDGRAARWWEERGCPYDSALALVGSGDIKALLSAARVFRDLGALPALAIAARELRELGVTQVPHPPRRARPSRPAGLTDREVDVLRLLGAGLRNADIAAHLVISTRTVDHHVSAILKKLHARSRGEAVSAGIRLGLIQA